MLARIFVLCTVFLGGSDPVAPSVDRPNAVSQEEIAKLVAGLGDASYETRTVAYRQLCVIGVEARELLEKAANGADAEAALRATQILSIFEQLLFTGCQVSLEFSKPEIAWDEPVDLVITIKNESRYDARIPFDQPKGEPGEFVGDARQVADMLDATEWLRTRSPKGEELELRMDDANGDSLVTQAVQSRMDNPVGSIVPPGKTAVVRIKDFNRGWARLSMLDAGEYTAMLDYKPQWDDSALIMVRAGRVMSNTAKVRVKQGAPAGISRGGSQAEILVEREKEEFVAKLRNSTDQTVVVNVNMGSSTPFSFGSWTVEQGENRRDLNTAGKSAATWADFDASRLVDAGPGATVELDRISVEKIRQVVKEATGGGGPGWTLHYAYTNLLDRNWQTRQGEAFAKDASVPPVLKQPLSRRLLVIRTTSERVPVSIQD